MSDVSVFETCTAQYTTDELDSLLQCISDGSAAVSNKKVNCFDRYDCALLLFFDSLGKKRMMIRRNTSLINKPLLSLLVLSYIFLLFLSHHTHPLDDTHIHPTQPPTQIYTHRQLPLLH